MEEISSTINEELRHSVSKLEFDAVIEMIVGYAMSERTREQLFSRHMLNTIDLIETSQKEIRELLVLREAGGDIPLSQWKDSWNVLRRISIPGSVVACEELMLVARGERKAADVARYLERHAGELPKIARYADGLQPRIEIIESITKAIGVDDNVLDSASTNLSKTRKRIGSLRRRLRKSFADFAAGKSGGKGYEFVTVRGDRYIVSMPRSEASHIRGIIHQTSGSGESLYIEPLEFVEGNNQLETLLREEKKEVGRILAELTAEVFDAVEDLSRNQDILLELDLISSKAIFASKYKCTMPIHSRDGTMILRGARHPLLEKRMSADGAGKIVGLDIDCGPDLDVLVISGPNAGGKTVALKTVGFIVMMDRHGLLVPCMEETVIPDHHLVFVDIGDDQSIERSLSTFSSRIVRMKSILALADKGSLVLIDEIGDGTDPEEGSSIACSLLEELSGLCGRTIVTTHMSALKGWAHEKDGAENATLEFDPEKLEPLFKMRMGIPGRSWGIEMAGRMGLPERIVEDAKNRLAENSLRLEELLGHLEKTERLLVHEKESLLKKEEELSGLISSYREHMDAFEKERDGMMLDARKEALGIVTSTRVEMERLVQEIRITQAEHRVIRKSKDLLQERRKRFESGLDEKKDSVPIDPADLVPGVWVMIDSLKKEGKILSAKDRSKVMVELDGGLRVETRAEDLSVSERSESESSIGRISWRADPFDPVPTELMIRGLERVEALEKVDIFLDRAVLQGLDTVRIIHGIGRGILKRAVYDMLRKDSRVADVKPGEAALGGDGVAIVRLK